MPTHVRDEGNMFTCEIMEEGHDKGGGSQDESILVKMCMWSAEAKDEERYNLKVPLLGVITSTNRFVQLP